MNDIQTFIEQTILMVGQSSNTVTYHRRYSLLNALMNSSTQSKETLKEKKDLVQKHDKKLLGKKFRKHIVEVTKERKTTIEAFSRSTTSNQNNHNTKSLTRTDPFPEAPQLKNQQGGRSAGRQLLLQSGHRA